MFKMWHVKLLNSRTQKFHEPRNHMSHGTSMKFENFRNFEQNLRVVQIPCDFLKSIFLIFLPENLNLYQKVPKIIRKSGILSDFWDHFDPETLRFQTPKFCKIETFVKIDENSRGGAFQCLYSSDWQFSSSQSRNILDLLSNNFRDYSWRQILNVLELFEDICSGPWIFSRFLFVNIHVGKHFYRKQFTNIIQIVDF